MGPFSRTRSAKRTGSGTYASTYTVRSRYLTCSHLRPALGALSGTHRCAGLGAAASFDRPSSDVCGDLKYMSHHESFVEVS